MAATLCRTAGIGGKLILTGLRSAVISNRNMALKVLKAWGRSNWPDGTTDILSLSTSI